MTRFLAFVAAALLSGLFSAGPSFASALYAVNFAGPTPLYSIDQGNGSATVVGGTLVDVGDLTSDGQSRLWSVTLTAGSNDLIQIDRGTGNTTSTLAITGVREGQITSLAYDPVTQRLFGNTTLSFGDSGGDHLYLIDPSTGAATFIGAVGFDNVFALGFSQGGTLFGVSNVGSELISIDTGTGAGSLIAVVQASLVFDIASRPEDNVMYAIDSGTASTYILDTGSGNLTAVGPWNGPNNLVGLAFTAPEPGEVALLGLSLAVLGFVRRRKPRA